MSKEDVYRIYEALLIAYPEEAKAILLCLLSQVRPK